MATTLPEHLCSLGLVCAMFAPAAAHAQDSRDPYVSIQGINMGGDYPYAMVSPWHTGSSGDTGTSQFQVNGPWSVQGTGAGEYRGGAWTSSQSAGLDTGVMRASLFYGSDDSIGRFSQLGTYLDMVDYITFEGSGTATFVMRLTGKFTGQAHGSWGNTMDTALDFTSLTRTGGRYNDVLGRIHLNHAEDGTAVFTSGTNCPGFGYNDYELGTVSCTIRSLDSDNIDIDLKVQVTGITDGEVLMFRSTLNVQAYGWGMGGTDFGNTARLGVVLSDGLQYASASGTFLSAAAPVPEPGTWALLLGGLAVVGLRARSRSGQAARAGC